MYHQLAAAFLLAIATLAGCQAKGIDTPARKTLTAFASEAQLQDFLKRQSQAQRARTGQQNMQGKLSLAESMPMSAVAAPPPAPAPSPSTAGMALSKMDASSAESKSEAITNTQTAGVDEGGIVKAHGKHLVMLRRGRLFTVDIDKDRLAPVSAIDAYAPDADPSGSWYDEMIISGDTVAVIGYSYQRGGTEIGLFDIDQAGQLRYRATYHMRSNDYYSSRNYASRQVGSKLIFYTPLTVNLYQPDPFANFPALRKWHPNAAPSEFKRIAPATRIYRTDDDLGGSAGLALHTVTVCDLARREMACEASAVMGPPGRVFYVSAESVYVWVTPTGHYGRKNGGQSGLFRMPLDGGAPSALKVAGAPVDQFSFLESGDGHLNVLVRAEGRGEGMWLAERGRGALALLRVPLRLFSDGRDSAPPQSYQPLPNAPGYALQNRYVGNFLLYGSSTSTGYDRPSTAGGALYAVRWDRDGESRMLSLSHGVERIEAMGDDAVVVGANGGDLHFTSVALKREAELADLYVRPNAAQGESRSHGFFYKRERADEGIVGLPILNDHGLSRGLRPAASILYLRNAGLKLNELGALASRSGAQEEDGCRASCADWYGNARPLFLKGRVFALMGYELVEGRVRDERMEEVRRISFAPQRAGLR